MTRLSLLALRSAWNRRYTLCLTVFSVGLGVALLLGVERLRQDARDNFGQSVSGVDLIVGARTAPVQIMLFAVMRLGEVSHNMTWASYAAISSHPQVAWSVPLIFGDSHHGFPVVGTTPEYFKQYRYATSVHLAFAEGNPFHSVFEAVIGAEVAKRLGYRPGDRIVLNHGHGDLAHAQHNDKPFTVTGILMRTGTAVDRSIHVSLESIEAVHLDWLGGTPTPGVSIKPEHVSKFDLRPKSISAALVGLKNRAAVFRVQRQINEYESDALTAVIPGVALDQLWQMVGNAERVLLAVSWMTVGVSLAGMVAVVLASLNERRRELAILRSVGARPRDIFALLTLEVTAVSLTGGVVGVMLLAVLSFVLAPFATQHYGLVVRPVLLRSTDLQWLGVLVAAGIAASFIPAYRAYRMSLSDGLTPRL